MPSIEQDKIDSANRRDIADYLMSRGIRLKRRSREYVWEEQNVWMRDNKWYSHYEQNGGYPVTFVMKYFGLTYQEAVADLNGDSVDEIYVKQPAKYEYQPKPPIELPPRNTKTYRMFLYLRNARGIDKDIINFFVRNGTLYESGDKHDCVFLGKSEKGVPCHAHLRSTLTSFKITVTNSQIEHAFHYNGTSDTIYAFEAPIDMLAFISMNKENWQQHSYVSLCSVSEKALMHQLEVNQNLNHIVLCLDNDEAGQTAEERITESLLEKGYADIERLIPQKKDWDEDLQKLREEEQQCQESKHSFSLGL